MPKTIEHIVEDPGHRLDKYLAQKNLTTSRSESAKLIKDGFVLVNGGQAKVSYQVEIDDHIKIQKPDLKIMSLEPIKIDFEILFALVWINGFVFPNCSGLCLKVLLHC